MCGKFAGSRFQFYLLKNKASLFDFEGLASLILIEWSREVAVNLNNFVRKRRYIESRVKPSPDFSDFYKNFVTLLFRFYLEITVGISVVKLTHPILFVRPHTFYLHRCKFVGGSYRVHKNVKWIFTRQFRNDRTKP